MWWEVLPPLFIYTAVFLQNRAHVLTLTKTLSHVWISRSVKVSTTDSACIYFSDVSNILVLSLHLVYKPLKAILYFV